MTNNDSQLMRIYLLIFCTGLFTMSLSAQCPDRDVLWKRIVYLRDTSSVPPEQQLTELLSRLDNEKNCADSYDSAHALLLQRIGWLISLQKDFAKAIEYSRKSIDIINNHAGKPGINRKHLIKTYNNLRIFYDSLKRSNLEAEAIDSCISIALNLKSEYKYAVPLIYSRTENLFEIGDYYRCINYAIIGENIARVSGYQAEHVFIYLIWRINSMIFLKKFDEAEELLFKAIVEARQIRYSKYLGTLYGLMAFIAEERKNVKMALTYSRQALFYDNQIKHYDGCSATLNNLGFNLYFQQLHQYDTALFYFTKALHVASPVGALNILDNIANVYVQKGNFDSAFYYFQKSFDTIRPGSDEQELLRSYRSGLLDKNVAEYIFGLLLDKGDAFLFRYKSGKDNKDLTRAVYIYRVADKLLNEIKTGQSVLQSKLFWRKEARRLYEHAITASYLENNYSEAFYFFEKSRAVLLQDQLNQLNKLSNNDILQQAQVKGKIAQLENELHTIETSSPRYTKIQNELATNTRILDRLEQLIKEHNPLYYQSFFDTSMIAIQNVQLNLLKDHVVLMEIFAGDSIVYSMLLTRDKIYFNSISKSDFDSSTTAYTAYISNFSLLNRRFQNYTTVAHHLYQLIFGDNPVPEGRIIISPDGHYFPFEALVTNVSNPASPVYFLNDHVVSYTYSARYLMTNFSIDSSSNATGDFLGVAPVNYASITPLAALQGSDLSLNNIKPYFDNANMLTSGKASRSNFLQQFSKYKIIQLYTHASDSSINGEPVIYFADSALYLSELIAKNKPDARLIVLAACETGNGKLYQGEGVFSFNRGFAAIGIPSSITNLWTVDNKATYKLTELFYKYLSDGAPVDIALQKAKLELMGSSREYRLPYYWAAAIVAGKTDAMFFKKSYSRKLFVIGGIVAGLGLLLIWLWKKNKKKIYGY